jgi:RloB-like protein
MAKNDRLRGYKALRRRPGTRPTYDRILIVCEGRKTECNYFNEIRQRFRISSAHVHIIPSEFGTDPKSVVKSAEEAFQRNLKSFERVYVVFDRDEHLEYANAIHMATARNGTFRNDEKKPVMFEAIVSVPCFEFWLLLHFLDVKHFLHRDEVFQELRRHILDYEKGMSDVFQRTEPLLSTAAKRAVLLKETFERIPGDEPYTDVHELVQFLLKLTAA